MTEQQVIADARERIRAEVEAISRTHQPDSIGYCRVCDPLVAYPCGPKWGADFALDVFDRRGIVAATNVPAQTVPGEAEKESAK